MAKAHANNNAERLNPSRAARRHLRTAYAMEEQLRTLLDSIHFGTVSGESCVELNGALPYLERVVAMLSTVERREAMRYAAPEPGR